TIHIPGKLNSTADSLSRLCRSGDYPLKDGMIQMICKTLNYMTQIDIFAPQRNKLINNYVRVDLNDLGTHFHNAFNYKWSKVKLYNHPPIPVLTTVLQKMKKDTAQGIIIAPIWPGQSENSIDGAENEGQGLKIFSRQSECLPYVSVTDDRDLIKDKKYPQDNKGNSLYNSEGQYRLKIHTNGTWRMSEIDDQLRCETLEDWQKYINQYHTLVVAHSINPDELWVSLIGKAYLQAVSNGYDSQGISGNETIYYLSRFILDGTWDVSITFNKDSMFDKLQKHFANNEVMVLITISYGAFPDFEEDSLGLDLNNTYALLNVIRVGNRKLLLIQNPKREKVWTKNLSIQDQKGLKDELQKIKRYQPETLEDDDVIKEGQFYMDSDDAQKYFKSETLNWNPSLFPYQTEFHFTWQSEYYKMKDSDMRCRYAPQFLFKKSSLTQKFMIVIARHYHRRNAVSFQIYENKKNVNMTYISQPMSITVYFMKHGKKVKSQSETGDEVINIIGDPDQEPSSSRIYSMNNEIIKKDFNFTRLKIMNVGIENKDDIYSHSNEDQSLDQRLEEEFSENFESRDEFHLSYIPPQGYNNRVENIVAPWQAMKYELGWFNMIQQLPRRDGSDLSYTHKYEILRVPENTDIFIMFIASSRRYWKLSSNLKYNLHYIGNRKEDYGIDEQETMDQSAAARIQ
ncbi:MAG: putative calpain, partial [Streblomastix strix]